MEPIERTFNSLDWITVIIFSSIIFLVIAKSIFYGRFLNFIILPFNNKYIFMYNKKDRLLNWFHISFTLFQLLNFSLFLYYVIEILIQPVYNFYIPLYPLLLASLLLFILIKVLVQLGNGIIFNNEKIISEIIFKKLSYLNYSSLVMLLANITLTYIFPESRPVLFIGIFLILLINSIGWITIVKNYQKFISAHFFYFILYLCALEIAPFVLIAGYLKD